MHRVPLSVTALSVVVAVALWYVATLLEGRRAAPAPSANAELPDFGRQQRESGLRAGRAAQRCEQAERRIQALVDDSRQCVTDDDCTIFDFGYPIQCLTSVAKSRITELRLEFRDYHESCEFRVYYDCPSAPLERRPVCRQQRCEVVLDSLDELRDETLDYLGIDPQR